MRFHWLSGLLWAGLLFAGNQQTDININSRYTVESVEIANEQDFHISRGLMRDMKRLVGEKLDPATLDDLAGRIRKEVRARSVTHKLTRGSAPDHVRVVFEITRREVAFDLSVPKFVYHSRQGWSGAIEATTTASALANSRFTFGLVSDGDELSERYAGIVARYENLKVGTSRVRLRFDFASYHDQWSSSTINALERNPEVPGIYRWRQNFAPVATFVVAGPVTLAVGTSFQRFQTQYPAARTEAANAVVTTLRYHRQIEDSDANRHNLDAGYSLRAATKILASDYAYARHHLDARYSFGRGNHEISDEVAAGILTGTAPLFDRYVLGNSATLRGWNKFDLDPIGGNRMVHNSVEYRYRFLQIFYDTGAVWDRGQDPTARHAVGVGFRKWGFCLAVAFPLKEGRVDPVFLFGMNY